MVVVGWYTQVVDLMICTSYSSPALLIDTEELTWYMTRIDLETCFAGYVDAN